MGIRGAVRSLIYGPPVMKVWSPEFVSKQLTALDWPVGTLERLSSPNRLRAWRRVSVREALGVPAIHRSVAIITSTTGMLSVEAYRNGVRMDDPPRIVTRPDPYQTPRAFYGGTAGDIAKYGEFVWWIATVDGDGLATSAVRVPLTELFVEENPKDRLMPRYIWGDKKGTRFSGANPEGRFVHEKYLLGEPFDLRGEGPLQLCGVANSVAVESQNWAGNFYGEGGQPGMVVKKAGILSPTALDPLTMVPDPVNGISEADILRNQIIGRPNNTTMVIDDRIESIEFKSPNPVGAQMLDARNFNNGDAAREFGIPGPLLEYSAQGSSLTYQNRTELKGHLLEMCLMPLYLEPIEQAMSDLLTRSTVARFNVKGFLRADIKTRFEVHGMAIDKGIYDSSYARREEGIEPGDVEYAPIPFAPPAAVPAALPKAASLRDVRCPSCNKLVAKTLGPGSELDCPRCKALVRGPEVGAAADDRPAPTELHVHLPEGMVHIEAPVTVQPAAVNVTPAPVTIAAGAVAAPDMSGFATAMAGMTGALTALASREQPAPAVTIADGAVRVEVNVPPPETPVNVNAAPEPRVTEQDVEYDERDRVVRILERVS